MLRDPFVGTVIREHRSWLKGAVTRDDVPLAVWDAIQVFESAMNQVKSHDWEEDKRKREAEDKARGHGGHGTWGPPGAQRPVHIPRRPTKR